MTDLPGCPKRIDDMSAEFLLGLLLVGIIGIYAVMLSSRGIDK